MEINALPVEVLLRIFFFAVSGVPSTRSAPLNISHTCRFWRDLSVNERTLWTLYDDRDCPDRHDDYLLMKQWLQLWLERAGDEPLEIHLTTSLHFGFGGFSVTMDLMKAIWGLQRQWKIFRFLRFGTFSIPYMELVHLPHLRELYLPFTFILPFGSETDDPPNGRWPAVWMPRYNSLCGPTAPNLRVLQTSAFSKGVLLNTLRHCPNIVELRLTSAVLNGPLEERFGNSVEDEGPPCILPALLTLIVAEPLLHLISHKIRTPSLSSLVLDTKTCKTLTETIRTVPLFIDTSGACPQSLVLLCERGSDGNRLAASSELLHLFESLPDVEEAVLGFRSSMELSSLLSSSQLLPKLSNLTLVVGNDSDLKATTCMLESRSASSKSFKAKLFLHARNAIDEVPSEIKNAVAAWDAEGRITFGSDFRSYTRRYPMYSSKSESGYQSKYA